MFNAILIVAIEVIIVNLASQKEPRGFKLSFHEDEEFDAVSPAKEMGAYEALWSEQGASFKSIANKFRSAPDALPSHFVDQDKAEEYKTKALELIRAANIGKFGIRVNGTLDYPKKLRVAEHPIELFYFQGCWDLVISPSVAVVGTRNPTEEGVRRTRKLVKFLVAENYTIASGLAKGVDSVAHKTAIDAGGRTFAVIGTPLTENYPKENKRLQEMLKKDYLVISQVPFVRYSKQTPKYNRLFFPERNKLMSALTKATIIVEASETSGTLIQAKAALYQKRKLMILDSCFDNPNITWPEKFLRQGAIRVKNCDDIREKLI